MPSATPDPDTEVTIAVFLRIPSRALRFAWVFLIAVAAIAFVEPEARATTLLRLSAEEHAHSAAAIVVATPRRTHVQLETTQAGETVFTYTELAVREVIKGDIRAELPLVLKHPGGTLGTLSLTIEGTPELAPGVEYLLFLAADPTPPYHSYFVQSFELGAWRLERRGDGDWAVRDLRTARAAVASREVRPDVVERVRLDRIRRLAPREIASSAPQVPPAYTPGTAVAARGGGSRFTLGDGPTRWRHPDHGEVIGLHVNAANFVYAAALGAAVDWAAGQWSSVPGSSLRVVNAGPTESCGFKGLNHVTSVAVDCLNEVPGQGCRSGVIAIGGPRTYERDPVEFNGILFRSTLSGDVVLNDPTQDSNGGCDLFDNQQMLNAVLTHEVGHVLGLGHSAAGEPGNRPTMFGYIQQGMETLHDDDIEAIRFLYPSPEPPARAPAIDRLNPALVEQDADASLTLDVRNVQSGAEVDVRITPSEGLYWEVRSVTPVADGGARLELRVLVDDDASPGVRTVVLSTAGGDSNAQVFSVSPMVAPSDLTALRVPAGGRRPPVDLAWSDSSSVETSVRVERLNPKSGAFEPLAAGYLPRNTTSFRDERPLRKKPNTYRLVYVNSRSGGVAYSNTVTAPAR